MKNYYALFFLLFTLSFRIDAEAISCFTLGNGTYENANNWSCGYVPGNGDTIIISAGDTINVTASHSFLEGVWLCIYGTMDFNNACRIVFAYGDTSIPASMITFFTGSSCINGNGSSGLSFGSGGSGCDVYRPGQGANPGVIPTVPGSYYDGCVWAAYLPLPDLWSHASLMGEQVLLEWSLKERPEYASYSVYGGWSDGQELLGEQEATHSVESDYYAFMAPIAGYEYYAVYLHRTDLSSELLFSFQLQQLMNQKGSSIQIMPNPFTEQLLLSNRSEFEVRLMSMDGRSVFEGSGENFYRLNTSDFANGLYILQLLEDGRVVHQEKLVKN